MAGIFRLRAIDVYRVSAIVPAPSASAAVAASPVGRLMDAASVVEALAAQVEAEGIVETVLDGLGARFGYERISLLLRDPARAVLTTIASRGYDRAGVGSEVPLGEGLIGSAAAQARPMRVSDMSRVRRFVTAVRDSSEHENRTRTIALPGMADARSQIAVPLIAQGTVRGVLFAESREALKFTTEDEAALTIVARHAAVALALAENVSEAAAPDEGQSGRRRSPGGRPFKVTHHAYDDSVFIDEQYVIKGVPGRLLMFMLEIHARDGRCDFSNRELRLAPAIRLPDIKDNLETRLLLLRRRLEEKASPVQLVRTGRGRIELQVAGRPLLEQTAGDSPATP
jgi:adenylate cyclase